MNITDKDFKKILSESIDDIPQKYLDKLQNVAFILEDEPTTEQRQQLNLYKDEMLFGLYEGVPLPSRSGRTKILPDKITLFRRPLEYASHSLKELKENVRHTVWHEVAHYFGLDHKRIHELERSSLRGPTLDKER